MLLRGQLAAAHDFGFDVTVMSSPGEIADRVLETEGVAHMPIAMERGIAPLRDIRSLAHIFLAVNTLRPHIVNAGTPKAGLLVTTASWLAGVPCRVHTLRGLRFETMRGPKRALLRALTKISCALAHRVICISPSLRDRALELGLAPADKLVVLGAGSSNGLDIERFCSSPGRRARALSLREQLGIPQQALVVGFAGRVAKDKGMVELIQAFQRLAEGHERAHLLIVGAHDDSDPIPERMAAIMQQHPRIHCAGHIDDMAAAYLCMDMLVLPTYREGFGNVLLEAGALERPVVASAVTGCVDAVEDGVTGTLVDGRDVAALARAIERYLVDEVLRARHGRAGRERVLRLFRTGEVWKNLHREYVDLMARRGVIDVDDMVELVGALQD
jgi:glycosyltransferase involved in cell wall biosynthesis